ERGALDSGALYNLLPGGRPVADRAARAEVAALWGVPDLPGDYGLDTAAILTAAREQRLGAVVIGGVDVDDLPDPAGALAALDAARFVVSLELRHSAVTERADVVFPVAAPAEKPGTFVDWEGRERPFATVLKKDQLTGDLAAVLTDLRVLDAIAEAMSGEREANAIHLPSLTAARREIRRLGRWTGERGPAPEGRARELPRPGPGEAVLATWRLLLDEGRAQDGEPHLAGTRRAPVVRLCASTAAEIGARDGGGVTVTSPHGEITLPLSITDMTERVVFLPANSPGSSVHRALRVGAGEVVKIRPADFAQADGPPNGTGRNGRTAHVFEEER
ncbi:molybdopterin dinucleotide binding domain-containing protein, partial [Streptomyces sp. SID3343]|uniref:molybdopterin dinucleotide binding domain-containing protein n=1 Tax=Streptomyces sp. SID3343 TaxID=2690260 RepID=UPI0013C050B5